MRFPVHVNLVIIGIETYKLEGSQLGVIKTSEGLSLAEAELERGTKSSETAMELVRKYIDIESFDPNLFLFSPTGFIESPQDIILVYKAVIPLNAFLKNEMRWTDFEIEHKELDPFCKGHLDIIKMVLQNG